MDSQTLNAFTVDPEAAINVSADMRNTGQSITFNAGSLYTDIGVLSSRVDNIELQTSGIIHDTDTIRGVIDSRPWEYICNVQDWLTANQKAEVRLMVMETLRELGVLNENDEYIRGGITISEDRFFEFVEGNK